MSSQKPKIGFFSLPAEIRCRIYEFALVCKEEIIPYAKPLADPPLAPSILQTCKQIHNEAYVMLYSKNEFLLTDPKQSFDWINQISPMNAKLLKKVHLKKQIFKLSDWDDVMDRLSDEVERPDFTFSLEFDGEVQFPYKGKPDFFEDLLARVRAMQTWGHS